MNYLKITLAVFLGLLVVGAGHITIGGGELPDISLNESNQDSPTEFDHTYPEHGESLDLQFENAPEYMDGVRTHNDQILKSSYTFTYDRDYPDGGMDLYLESNPSEEKVYGERTILAPEDTLNQEIYYEDSTQHIRIRPEGSSTSNWEYKSNTSEFRDANRTAFSELRALEVSGVKFKLKREVTQNDINYFVYEPVVVDEKAFKSIRFDESDQDVESYSINGEVVLSEYGLITSADVNYTIGGEESTITYSLENIGSTEITRPAWVQNN